MDKEKLKAYGVDYENAVKRFAGNEALYERFLKKIPLFCRIKIKKRMKRDVAMKDDQRIALTKRLLREGLLRLLSKTDLNKISVTQLCIESGICRCSLLSSE